MFLNVDGSNKAVEGSKPFMKEIGKLPTFTTVNSWTFSGEPVPVQSFPIHTIYFFRNMYKSSTIFEKCWHIMFCNGLRNCVKFRTAKM